MPDIRKYEEIINMPHHISERHPPLEKDSYTAQFSPFESLTGFDIVVEEVARVTDNMICIDEDEKSRLSDMIVEIIKNIDSKPEITFRYFIPDAEKDGGKFVSVNGTVKKYSDADNTIMLSDGTIIPVESIVDIQGSLFG